MTDKSPYPFVEINCNDLVRYFKELAHLRKSHAALRGWCGQYRRKIERLEAQLMEPYGPSYCCDHLVESMDDKLPKWDCIYCHVAELEAQIATVKETTDDPYVFVVQTEDGKKPMSFVAVADVLASLERSK